MAYNALQSAKYDTNTAAISHVLGSGSTAWWGSNFATPSGTTTPSTVIVSISYDGTSSDQVSGITDDQGNTYYKAVTCNDNTNAVHNELWYAHNAAGGVKPSITVSLSSSLKCTFVASEFPYIWWFFDPKDQTSSRIDISNATSRATLNLSSPMAEADELVIGGLGWNNGVTTTIGNGANCTTDVYNHNSSSNLGAAIAHRTNDGGTTVAVASGRIFFSIGGTARTTPHGVTAATFKRVGVFTTSTEDGLIQNLEGSATVDTADTTDHYVVMTSASAPFGGTGTSEKTDYYAFFDTTKFGALPAGVTLSSAIYNWRSTSASYDDGLSYGMAVFTDPTGPNGSTLTSDDEGRPATFSSPYYTLIGDVVVIDQDNTLNIPDGGVNLAGATSLRQSITADVVTSSVQYMGARSSRAHFLRFTVNYPSTATPKQFSLAPHLLRFGNEDTNPLIRL